MQACSHTPLRRQCSSSAIANSLPARPDTLLYRTMVHMPPPWRNSWICTGDTKEGKKKAEGKQRRTGKEGGMAPARSPVHTASPPIAAAGRRCCSRQPPLRHTGYTRP